MAFTSVGLASKLKRASLVLKPAIVKNGGVKPKTGEGKNKGENDGLFRPAIVNYKTEPF
jgi:hypothetical protein